MISSSPRFDLVDSSAVCSAGDRNAITRGGRTTSSSDGCHDSPAKGSRDTRPPVGDLSELQRISPFLGSRHCLAKALNWPLPFSESWLKLINKFELVDSVENHVFTEDTLQRDCGCLPALVIS